MYAYTRYNVHIDTPHGVHVRIHLGLCIRGMCANMMITCMCMNIPKDKWVHHACKYVLTGEKPHNMLVYNITCAYLHDGVYAY